MAKLHRTLLKQFTKMKDKYTNLKVGKKFPPSTTLKPFPSKLVCLIFALAFRK